MPSEVAAKPARGRFEGRCRICGTRKFPIKFGNIACKSCLTRSSSATRKWQAQTVAVRTRSGEDLGAMTARGLHRPPASRRGAKRGTHGCNCSTIRGAFHIATGKGTHGSTARSPPRKCAWSAADGEQLGIVESRERQQDGRGSRTSTWWRSRRLAMPPVCRSWTTASSSTARARSAHEAKLKQKQIQVKEIKFRPGTDEGDYKIKLRNLIAVPRGRRQGEGHAALPRPRDGAPGIRRCGCWSGCEADLEPYGVVEQFPKLEGRQMVMVLAPKKKLVTEAASRRRRRRRSGQAKPASQDGCSKARRSIAAGSNK